MKDGPEKTQLLQTLQQALKDMDLPAFRKMKLTEHNLEWLQTNLGIRNGNHKQYETAMQLLQQLLDGGVA